LKALLFSIGCGAAIALAHDVISTKITWTREVSRLVYARCICCHRVGGAAFSLAAYRDARPWAKAIKEEVLARRMPPWGAVRGFGDLAGEVSLSQEEMDTIAQWVEGGSPEGDPALLPKLPQTAAGSCFPSAPAGTRIHVQGGTTLTSDSVVLAIVPAGDVIDSSRITAMRPDGSAIPLLWLYQYRREFAHPFLLRERMLLKAGTVVESRPSVSFDLITSASR